MTEIYLSDGEFAALEYLVTVGPVFANDIEPEIYWDFVRLKDVGFAVMQTPDPNFLYMLPEERRDAYQFKFTNAGYNEYLRLKQMHDERADQEERQRAQDNQLLLDKKKDQRHDFCVAAFGGAVTLIVEHFDVVADFVAHLLVP